MDKQLAVCQEKILALARLFHIDPFQPEDEVRSHSRALSLARVMAGTMELVVLSRGVGWGLCSKRVGGPLEMPRRTRRRRNRWRSRARSSSSASATAPCASGTSSYVLAPHPLMDHLGLANSLLSISLSLTHARG